ncbi:MAG: hypothetical protein QM500_04425 [Methylococcales bacterium]
MPFDDICEQVVIEDGFPIKGAAVLVYLFERGENSGAYFIGVVEACGKKTFKIRWGDGFCEQFTSKIGNNDFYRFYAVLSYITYHDYYKCGINYELQSAVVDTIKQESQPCHICIKKYKEQVKLINSIKRDHQKSKRCDTGNIKHGVKIKFIYIKLLDIPFVSEGYTRLDEGDLYVDDHYYDKADDEDDHLHLVKKSFILEC